RVGGGREGAGPEQGGLRPADRVAVERGAFVTVSARDVGDGGEAIFWSDDATLFYGSVGARGGGNGGDGGFVEVSSRLDLAFAGEVDLSAPLGAVGEILFDPRDIRIVSSGGDDIAGDVDVEDVQPNDLVVNAGSIAAINGAVTLQASRDIVFEAGGVLVNFRADSIAFQAGRDVVIGTATVAGDVLSFVADAAFAGRPSDGVGAIRIDGSPNLIARTTLSLSAPQGLIGTGMAPTDLVTLRARTDLTVPDADLAGGLAATSASGTLTFGDLQAASLSAVGRDGLGTAEAFDIAGAATFETRGAAVTLGHAGNRFGGPVSFNTRDLFGAPQAVTLVAEGSVQLGDIAATTLDVTASGALSGGGLIKTSGESRFEAASIDLTGGSAVFGGRLSLLGDGDASVVSSGAVSLGDVSLASLALTAGEAVDEAAAGTTSIAGAASFVTSGDAVSLQRAGGVVGGPISVDTEAGGAAAATVKLSLAGDLTLGDISADALAVTAGGAVGQGASHVLDVQTLDLTAGGPAALLGSGNAFGGEIDISAAEISLVAASGLQLGQVATSGPLTLSAGGPVSQSAAGMIDVAGDVAIATSGGSVVLTNAGNVFGGEIAVATAQGGAAAADVTLDLGAAALVLGDTEADALSVTALGGVVQSGTATAAATRVTTGGGAVNLGASGNAFGPIDVDTTAGGAAVADVVLASDGALELGDIAAATLSVAAGGAVSQTGSGVLDISGVADFATEGGAVNLSNANRFGGAIFVDTTADGSGPAAVAITDADALTFGAVTASALTIGAGGAVDQAAVGALDIAGDVVVETAGGAVTLSRAANVIGGHVAVDTTDGGAPRAAATLAADGGLKLGPITAQTLSVATTGPVADRAGGVIDVAGEASFATSGAALSLDAEAGHLFGGPIALDVGAASLVSAGGVVLQGLAASLDVAAADLEASGALSIDGGAGALSLRSLAGQDLALGGAGGGFDISQGSLDLISAGATTATAATGRFLRVRGGAALTGLGDVALAADGGVTFEAGGATFAGALDIASGGPVVGVGSAITTGGATTIVSAGDVSLSAPNAFGGAVAVSAAGRAVSLRSAADIVLADVSAGALSVHAPGGIDAQGVLTVTGDATLGSFDSLGDGDAASGVFGDVAATASGNRIDGVLSVVGDAVDVAVDGDLRLEDGYARSALTARAGGSVDIARVAVGPGAPAVDALALPPGGALSVSAGGAISASDVQAGQAGFGGAGTSSSAAAAGADAIALDRLAVDALTTGDVAGALEVTDAAVAGDARLGEASTMVLRRVGVGGDVLAEANGALRLDGVRAARIEGTGASVELSFVEAGSADLTATAGDIVSDASFAATDLGAGSNVVVAAPTAPRNDADSGSLVLDAAADLSPFADLVAVAGELEIFAAGAVDLRGGEVGGTFRSVDLGALSGDAGGDVAVTAAGALELGALTVGGGLTASAGADMSQSGPLDVAGAASIDAVGDVTLNDPLNVFAGGLSLDARSAEVASAGPLRIGGSALDQSLVATALAGTEAVVVDGKASSASLILNGVDVGGAGVLVGIGAEGVAASNIRAMQVTLGGIGTAAGAPAATTGDVLANAFSVGALSVAATGAAHLSDAVIGDSLSTAGAASATVERTTFGPDAATSFVGLTDGLVLHRVHARGDLAVEVAGDLRIGRIRATAGAGQAGSLSLSSTAGSVLKLPDDAIDAAAGGDGLLELDFGPLGVAAVASEAAGPFTDLVFTEGNLTVSASGDVLLSEGAGAGGVLRTRVGAAAALTAGGDVAITSRGSLSISGLNAGGDALLRVREDAAPGDGGLSQTGAVSVAGRLTVLAEGDATLADASNAFAEVSGDIGGAARLRDADGFVVGDLRAEALEVSDQVGAVVATDVATTGGLAIKAGSLEVSRLSAGALSLSATGGDVLLADAQAGATSVSAEGAISLSRFALGDLSAEAGATLTVADGSAGDSLGSGLSAVGDLALNNLRLGATTASSQAGLSAERVDAVSLNLAAQGGDVAMAGVATSGDLTAEASGSIRTLADAPGTLSAVAIDGPAAASLGDILGPRLGDPTDGREVQDLDAVAGRVLAGQAVAGQIIVGGDARLVAGDAVDLPLEADALGGAVNRIAGALSLETGGDAAVEVAGGVTLGLSQVGGALSVRSNADGADLFGTSGISQTAAVRVDGLADLVVGAPDGASDASTRGDVILDRVDNAFTELSVAARSAALQDADGFLLSSADLTGDLSIGQGTVQAGQLTLRDLAAVGAVSVAAQGDVLAERIGSASLSVRSSEARTDLAQIAVSTLSADAATDVSVTDATFDEAAIDAGDDAVLTRLTGGVLDASAGGGLVAADLEVSTLSVSSGGDGSLSGVSAEMASGTFGGSFRVEASTLGTASLTAGGDGTVLDHAGGSLTAGADGALTVRRSASTGALIATSGGTTRLEDASAATISASSGGALRGLRVAATGAASFDAAGDLTLTETSALSLALTSGGSTTLSQVSASQALTSTAGSGLSASDATATTIAATATGGDASVERTSATGDLSIDVQAGALTAQDLGAGDDIAAITSGRMEIARLDVGGALTAMAGGRLTLEDAAAARGVLTAGGAMDASRLALSGDLEIVGDAAATLVDVSAGRDLDVEAVAALTLERVEATRATTLLSGGEARITSLRSDRLTATFAGDAVLDRAAVASNGALQVGGGLSATNLEVGGDLTVGVGEGLSAARLIVSGDAALTSGDALSLTRASIGGALQATADLDGSAGDAAATLRNVGVGALAIDAGEAVDLDAVSVTRNASLRARRGDIRLGSVLVEGDAIFVAEQGSIRTQAGRAERDDFAVNLTFAPEAPQGLSSASPGAGSGVVTRSRVAARAFETLLAVEG
ncbi:MAG: hypothetical protein AAF763_09380, partial [Pseudomonadota bacterium]